MIETSLSRRLSWGSWLRFAALPLLGVVVLLLMTRWGIGTFPDSAHYIKGARQLVSDLTGGAPVAGPGEIVLTQLAPFYSILLAIGGLAGLDPMDGTRWLNAALFGLNIFVVGFILRRSTHATLVWIAGSVLMLASVPVLSVHVSAMSEPVFLLLTLTGFYLLARYLETATLAFLISAGLAIGFAFLSRYAAAACVLTGATALILWGPNHIGRRVRDVVVFGALSALPMLAWMLRNVATADTATGREFVVHLVDRSHVWQALYTVSSWLHIPPSAPDLIRLTILPVLGLGVLAVAAYRSRAGTPPPMIIRTLCLFVVVYGAFLVASISFFDANTPLDDRILFPAFAAALIVVLHAVDGLWRLPGARPAWRAVIATALIGFMMATVARSAGIVAGSYASGWGFTSLAWQRSATLSHVRTLPEQDTIYSNAPEIIYLNTERAARPIPKRWLPMNRQLNPTFDVELRDVERELRATGGVVVYFRDLPQAQRSLPSLEELTDRMSLRVLADEPDGTILRAADSRQANMHVSETP